MLRLLLTLAVLGILSTALAGCHASAGVDPNGATSVGVVR